jgi:cytochrome c oxidase cbb3-type subunit 3
MQKVASYILSLQGTNPANAKAPQGEVWVEPTSAPSDTSTVKTDTTKAMAATEVK